MCFWWVTRPDWTRQCKRLFPGLTVAPPPPPSPQPSPLARSHFQVAVHVLLPPDKKVIIISFRKNLDFGAVRRHVACSMKSWRNDHLSQWPVYYTEFKHTYYYVLTQKSGTERNKTSTTNRSGPCVSIMSVWALCITITTPIITTTITTTPTILLPSASFLLSQF